MAAEVACEVCSLPVGFERGDMSYNCLMKDISYHAVVGGRFCEQSQWPSRRARGGRTRWPQRWLVGAGLFPV